ncbi:MAG: tetratricopeptide repeat protein [Syntrophobacteraceae bacterium]|jgi:serine/threonine-protein kinase|nr:tetratricopeptide repeat protein [Syntrophobacteraceae bacterium]
MLHPSNLIGKQIDQFRLDEFIAKGAMGMVFKAFDTVLMRTVALKLISKQMIEDLTDEELTMREEARKRLIQEAKTAGRLNHPNILTIYSYGETDDFEYICMEYLKGKTLNQLLSQRKVIEVDQAISILEQILLALDAANQEQIVHRDIKPSNIMMTDDGRLKVMDFGIAKLPSFSMTTTGTVLGTPYYMSPEQISGQKVDIRSDIFSVGAVLYQIVTGERPFEATNTATLAYKIVQVDPIPPDLLNVHVPHPLGVILRKSLAKHPSERYQSPVEMMQDLKAVKEKKQLPSQMGAAIPANGLKAGRGFQARAGEMDGSACAGSQGLQNGTEAEMSGDAAPSRGRVVEFRRNGGAERPEEREGPGPGAAEAAEGASEERDPAMQPPANWDHLPTRQDLPHLFYGRGVGGGEQAYSPKRYRLVGVVFVLIVVAGFWYVAFNAFREIKGVVENSTQANGAPQEAKAPAPASTQALPEAPAAQPSVEQLILEARSIWPSDPAAAQSLLEKAAAMQPDHFEASFQLARLLAHRMDYAAAKQQYEKTLLINKSNPEVFFNLGHIHLTQGDYDSAIRNLEACLALNPTYKDEVFSNLGISYLKKDLPDQARDAFRRALEINPSNAVARAHLATLLPSVQGAGEGEQKASVPASAGTGRTVEQLVAEARELMEKDPPQARLLLDEAILREPGDFDAVFQLGRLLTFQKDYAAAIQRYERALELNPASADALFNLGYIHLVSKDYDKAIQHYESCLALSPPYRDEVLTNLGLGHLKKMNLAEARKLFEEALKVNPDNQVARGYLRNMDKLRRNRSDVQLTGAPTEPRAQPAALKSVVDANAAEAASSGPPPLEGDYLVEGVNPSGSTYKGKASVKRKGDEYTVTWVIANVKFSGKGSLNGDRLAVNWQTSTGESGSLSYQLNQDGTLKGSWADGAGAEMLVPVGR